MRLHGTSTADNAIPGVFDFTEILINDSWDGEFTFIEPMTTREWMPAKTTIENPISQPAAYQRTGYYSTIYSVRFDEQSGDHVIALSGLRMREGS